MKRVVQIGIGIALGAALIWLLFRRTDWAAVWAAVREIRLEWLLVSQAFVWGTFFARVQRWSYVVRASCPARYRHLFSATQIAFLVNFTLPARAGEFVRPYVLSRLAKRPLSQCIAMAALDRVNDLFALIVVLLLAMLSLPKGLDIEFPAGAFGNAEPIAVSSAAIRPAASGAAAALCGMCAVLVFLYVNQGLVLRAVGATLGRVSARFAAWLERVFVNFAAGMHVFRSPSDLAKATGFSLLTWGGGVGSSAAMMAAFDIPFPWYAPLLMLALIAVFISVPVTPGAVGQYHIPVIACLLVVAPGLDPARAKAVALVTHLFALFPVGVLGVFCLIREQIRFTDLLRVRPEADSA
ncbi:MAG: flippase-like domain-containing protein [Candidatus Hydrogenedentes bacterium]|nr:flippase-like domain-containing protein [Candidatus Hydrogenedentota bacterium]